MARPTSLTVVLLATSLTTLACSAQSTADEPPAASSSPPSATATEPPAETAGYASAFLGAGGASGSDDVFVHASVWSPPGEEAFANGEFFVLGWDCLTDGSVPATVDGLESASARGELALTCGSHTHEGEITGTAELDLTWTADGPVERHMLESANGDCAEDLSDRHAVVTGQVRLLLPELGFDGVAVPLLDDDDSISQGMLDCA